MSDCPNCAAERVANAGLREEVRVALGTLQDPALILQTRTRSEWVESSKWEYRLYNTIIKVMGILQDAHDAALSAAPPLPPLDVVLHCPSCGLQHIDKPEPGTGWTNPPHKSHKCHGCGVIWRASDEPTNGIAAPKTRGSADTWDVFDPAPPLCAGGVRQRPASNMPMPEAWGCVAFPEQPAPASVPPAAAPQEGDKAFQEWLDTPHDPNEPYKAAAPQEQQGTAEMADITLCPRCGRPDPMFGNVKPTNATEQCWRRLLKAGNSIYVDTLCIAPASAASEPKAPPQEEKEKK